MVCAAISALVSVPVLDFLSGSVWVLWFPVPLWCRNDVKSEVFKICHFDVDLISDFQNKRSMNNSW